MGIWLSLKSACNVGANTIRVFVADEFDAQHELYFQLGSIAAIQVVTPTSKYIILCFGIERKQKERMEISF